MSQDPYRVPPEPQRRGPAPGRRPDQSDGQGRAPNPRVPAFRPRPPGQWPGDPADQPTAVMPLPIRRSTRRYEPPPPVGYDPEPYPRRVVEYVPRDEQPPRHPEPLDQAYRRHEESPLEYQRERDRRTDRGNLIANTIRVVTALVALVFVLHIVFTVFGANQDNGFVAFDYAMAKVFVLGFGDVFTPGDATIGLIANYGLAAIVYLVVGRLLYGTLRRG